MKTLIKNAFIVNEGKTQKGMLIIENDTIADIIYDSHAATGHYGKTIDAQGSYLLPGIIDDHVHFREPGLTQKADIKSESRAAAYGGVTSYFDMPNTKPQTTTLEDLADKMHRGKEESYVNYSFFFGATNGNTGLFQQLDIHHTPGIKLFMGSSTGNMLVDRADALDKIFSSSPLPIMTHCEDTSIINANMAQAQSLYGDDPDVSHHPEIRSEEACYASTRLAVELAKKHHARLHVAHVTTAKELTLFEPWVHHMPSITAEAVIAHLMFSDKDYKTLGVLIKCNPAIKTEHDQLALQKALTNGRISVVGTDHAPHLIADKQGGCCNSASGMPMIQFSLVSMLELVDKGVLTVERVAELMCHRPAQLFEIRQRGYLRKGYKADLTIVSPHKSWKVTAQCIQSKCGWSPLTGHTFHWHVDHTFCNGRHILDNGKFDDSVRGEEILFR